MKIVYVAKHNSGGNDDEGAIAFALRELGTEVVCLQEDEARDALLLTNNSPHLNGADAVLFHKWKDLAAVSVLSQQYKTVCWYFDMVDAPGDRSLAARSAQRCAYLRQVEIAATHTFCTDGDWVKNRTIGQVTGKGHKMSVLRQGADSRIMNTEYHTRAATQDIPILFTGISNGGGRERVKFVRHMAEKYGKDFYHVSRGVYREDHKALVARAKIVVCPHYPVTDNYWSNRVYNAAGFGGCVLHVESAGLLQDYTPEQIAYYRHESELINPFQHLDDTIKLLLDKPEMREQLSHNALERTLAQNTYRHRVEHLLREIV